MSKTKMEKVSDIDQQIAQLKKRKQLLRQQHGKDERKARTKRLCSRHGMLEKYMPDLIIISDEMFEDFIRTGIDTKYGRSRLAEIIAKQNVIPADIGNPQAVTQDCDDVQAENESGDDE